MRLYSVAAVVMAALCRPIAAFAAPVATTKSAPDARAMLAMRKQVFEIVWRTVGENHFDPKMNGVDWNAVHRRYAPKVAAVQTEEQFYDLLNTMLGELKQSHLEALSPTLLHDMEGSARAKGTGAKGSGGSADTSGESGDPGMTVEWIEDQPIVVRVTADGPAAVAGIKPGYVVTSVDGKAILPVIQKLLASHANIRTGEARVEVWSLMRHLLQGTVGKPLPVSVKDESGAGRTVSLTPATQPGQLVTFGALPPLPADIETKTLANGVGYIRFSIFLMPLSEPVKEAIRGFAAKNAPGIIFDLRGNVGGIGGMASGIAGVLVNKDSVLGTMRMRTMSLRFPIFSQPPTYLGPVAILTDEGSVSTSEIMAGGLQEMHRAIVVGRTTAGMVLPSAIVTLPDGGRLQYVVGDFRTPKGTLLEGRGVIPDVPVTLTRASLLASPTEDPILAAALAHLTPKETTTKP